MYPHLLQLLHVIQSRRWEFARRQKWWKSCRYKLLHGGLARGGSLMWDSGPQFIMLAPPFHPSTSCFQNFPFLVRGLRNFALQKNYLILKCLENIKTLQAAVHFENGIWSKQIFVLLIGHFTDQGSNIWADFFKLHSTRPQSFVFSIVPKMW